MIFTLSSLEPTKTLSYHPQGKMIACGSYKVVSVVDPASKKKIVDLDKIHNCNTLRLLLCNNWKIALVVKTKFSLDGKMLLSCDNGKGVSVVESRMWKRIALFDAPHDCMSICSYYSF